MIVEFRGQIVDWAKWGVLHRASIHYAEVRPIPHTAALPLTTDCSGFFTLCYQLAGAPDPNGQNYDGEGYTGTLLDHGREIPLAEVLPGDAIVYGPGTGEHVAMVVETGADPLTISHGQEGDPSYVRVSQDGRQPQRYLRFETTKVVPDPPKPPVKKAVSLAAKLIKSPVTMARNLLTRRRPCVAPHPGGGEALCYPGLREWQGIPNPTERDRLIGVGVKQRTMPAAWWKTAKQVAW